jgi:hypothetical protein
MAAFQVFCDESGEQSDPLCITFASVVFDVDEIPGFVRKWKELLGQAGIRYLAMKEVAACNGEFSGWKDRTEDRNELLHELSKITFDRSVFNVNSTVGKNHDPVNFKKLKAIIAKIAVSGFEALLKGIVEWSKSNPEIRCHLIYDISEAYSRDCMGMFNKLRSLNSVYKQRFSAITFADDTECPPLQAADMLAYCFRQISIRDGLSNCIDPVKTVMTNIGQGKPFGQRDLVYREGTGINDGVIRWPVQ